MSYALRPNQPINFNNGKYSYQPKSPEELEKTGKLYLLYTLISLLFSAIFSYQSFRVEGAMFYSYFFIVYGIASGIAAYFFLRQSIKIRQKKERLEGGWVDGKQN